ncbi:nif-specific transcriptional activator NifA [Thioalbus denitrificans]|uniref:Nif-specific regulatory protein n=1 Tax=Thioalbus denitrificans TaxID=547122 RepID=A0A369CDK1_9GAMM|nr:nif-specific transcriptional activator NifA [Thioalbus denitrificans]RCX31989.1 Nif-specific regulatory protein [Thioalbus denitrificans]
MTDFNTPKDTSLFRLIADQLEALYAVSRVLSQSLNVHETLLEVLKVLDEQGGLSGGMIALEEEETGELLVSHTRGDQARWDRPVRYGRGEGLVGTILAEDQPVVVRRLADEPRFLDRLGIYQAGLPFVGVPIRTGVQDTVGVLTAQPPSTDFLPEQVRFLEMVSNLIARIVLLSREVESERRQLEEERDKLRRTVRGNHGFENIVGHTDIIRRVFDQVRQVAKWNTTVLIRGESGTGKELVANAIHYNSPRSSGPFVKLNCAALPDNLLESELFGHEKGAFTGAVAQRKGRFEQADGGTIFLDEIGEISAAFQAKLLRVLQEGEFERVGGTRTHKVDVRVIAATNRDLEREVEEGVFREDLYYRLNVMPIRMPALRERIEDIPELSSFLVEKIARIQGRPLEITDSAVRLLMRHRWPGNVRELENCLERAAVMCEGSKIDRDAIVVAGLSEHSLEAPPAADTTHKVDFNDPDLDERERVIAALEEAGWVQAKAARLLGMTPRQIAYRIQTLNIRLRQI